MPFLLFGGIFFAFFLPVLLAGPQQLIFGDDIHQQYYFYRQFFNLWLSRGVFPWWNPYTFSGAPFIADPSINIWYLPNWLFVVLPIPYAYIIHFWFHLTLGASSMYLLVRYITPKRNSIIPAITAGFVFSFSGFMTSRIMAGHVDIVACAAYMPLIVLVFWRIMNKPSIQRMAIAGIFLGCQLLSGYQTMAFFTLIVVGLISVFTIVKTRTLNFVPFMIGALLVGFGLSAINLVPMQQALQLSIRTINRPYEWAVSGSMPVSAFIQQLFSPFPYGRPSEYVGPPLNFHEHAFYFGAITTIFLVLGWIYGIYKKRITILWIVFFFIACFGIWVSCGNYASIDLQHILWIMVPYYRMIRIPTRHLIIVIFSVSVLTGLTLDSLRNRLISFGFLILLLWELFPYGQSMLATKEVPDLRYDSALVAYIKSAGEFIRILPNYGSWIEPRNALPFNVGLKEQIFSATGYDPMIYRPYYDFIDATNGSSKSSISDIDIQIPYVTLSSKAMEFLTIRYLMTPTYAADPLGGKSTDQFTLVKEDVRRQYRIYENKNVFPRFFFVPNTTQFDTYANLTTAIREQRIDFRKTVAVEKKSVQSMKFDADCTEREVGSVDILSFTPNTVTLRAVTPCNAFLVSSEVMYPGWRATIDNKETPIITGNMAFRVLYVPKGEHRIVFSFVPTVFVVGGAISLFTILLLCGIFYLSGRQTISHHD